MKPKLIVTEPSRQWYEKWNALTQEDRKQMSADELIRAMGPLHCQHPEYKPRPVSLVPMPNLAGRQPVISCHEYGIFAQFRAFFGWAFQ